MISIFLTLLEDEADRARFTWIYEQYHGRMEQTAIRLLGRQGGAEDAVQNAFLQVIRHFEKIDTIPCEELPFWLISIVKNEARMILRKRKNTVPFEDWEQVQEAAKDVSGYEELVELFRQLPESYRGVLEMKMLLGYTDREVALRLNLSETAVSTRATRGRALLRAIAEREGVVP